MSLVNDVLRQLDKRATVPDHGIVLHPPLAINEASSSLSTQSMPNKILLMAIIVLALIIVIQILYQKPLLNLFVTPVDVHENSPPEILLNESTETVDRETVVTTNTISDPIHEASIKVASVRVVAVDEVVVDEVTLADSRIISTESIPLESKLLESKPVVVKALSIDSSITRTLASNTSGTKRTDMAIIKPIQTPGLKQYELALKSYQQKRFNRALEWVGIAINESKREKYLALKVRILLQQKNAHALYTLALSNSSITTQSWFELMAPSLQILSFHELSNQYYAQLIVQQPKMIKWQLAMALNYSRLGDANKTYAIYKKVLDSSSASARQKQWLESQIVRLNREQGNS